MPDTELDKMSLSSFWDTSFIDNGGKPMLVEIGSFAKDVIYPQLIYDGLKDPEQPLFTHMGLRVAKKYNKIIISDYGIYFQVAKEDIIRATIQQKTGSSTGTATNNVEFRLEYISNDGEMELFFQVREGGYFKDFEPDFFYIRMDYISTGQRLPIIEQNIMMIHDAFVCQDESCRGQYVDVISPKVSEMWPFVKEEYRSLCDNEDPLSLLGNFQVIPTNEEQTEAIVNVFCNMGSQGSGRNRRSGINAQALVSAIYSLATYIPDQKIVIPYMIGCSNEEEWESLYLKLSCRLQDQNVVIVKHIETPEELPEEHLWDGSDPADMDDRQHDGGLCPDELPQDETAPAEEQLHDDQCPGQGEAMTAKADEPDGSSLLEEDAMTQLQAKIFTRIREMDIDKTIALALLLDVDTTGIFP